MRLITILVWMIIVIVVSCIEMRLQAQVNLKIGYTVAFPQLVESDDLLAAYQIAGGEQVDDFGRLRFVHGIQLGIRYRVGNSAVELGWERMNRDRSALFYLAASDSFEPRVYNYSLSAYMLGVDQYFGKWGIGSGLKSQSLGIGREIGSNTLEIVNERQWHLQIRVTWLVQRSKHVSLALQPYYQMSLSSYDVSNLARDVKVSGLSTDMKPAYWGMSVIFYNGRQRR